MELKLSYVSKSKIACKVLIEPLWNWNHQPHQPHTNHTSINRTFMELKHAFSLFILIVYVY